MFLLPDPTSVTRLSSAAKVEVLDHLFEPCPTLAKILLPTVMAKNHHSYRALVESARAELLALLTDGEPSPDVAKIIAAHPRLGPSKDKLSGHSSSEQKSLSGTAAEAEKLRELNEQYEAAFPGLRYVVFVNGRLREEIMANMVERIQRGSIAQEQRAAFDAMCDIALDRAKKLGAKL